MGDAGGLQPSTASSLEATLTTEWTRDMKQREGEGVAASQILSAILVDPVPELIDLLDAYHEANGRPGFMGRYFHREENGVYMVRSRSSVDGDDAWESYLETLKPRILCVELARLRVPLGDVGSVDTGASGLSQSLVLSR